jgi:putative CocE/NonD family hydrolase
MTEAHIFETGTACWRRFDQWPPKGIASRPLHLREGGALRFEAPRGNAEAFDEYISDPAKPVPFTLEVTTDYPRGYPTHDQRFAASRPDVLVYETEPLEEDLTLAGPIPVSLHVSTTGTDAAWVVTVIDVFDPDYPEPEPNPSYLVMGGYQQLVRGDVFRSRFRNSFEKPEPMEPGKVTRITFTLPDVCHTFRRGHRLMVQVQSTWFPLVDRNPQTYVDIYRARPEDYRKATQRIHRGETTPSMLTLPVLPR